MLAAASRRGGRYAVHYENDAGPGRCSHLDQGNLRYLRSAPARAACTGEMRCVPGARRAGESMTASLRTAALIVQGMTCCVRATRRTRRSHGSGRSRRVGELGDPSSTRVLRSQRRIDRADRGSDRRQDTRFLPRRHATTPRLGRMRWPMRRSASSDRSVVTSSSQRC